jgi:Na+/melibiose symporter-like transporter
MGNMSDNINSVLSGRGRPWKALGALAVSIFITPMFWIAAIAAVGCIIWFLYEVLKTAKITE